MTTFKKALEELRAAHEASDVSRKLKAQSDIAMILLENPDEFTPDRIRLLELITKTQSELTKIDGLKRKFSEEEKEDLAAERALRKVLGKGSPEND